MKISLFRLLQITIMTLALKHSLSAESCQSSFISFIKQVDSSYSDAEEMLKNEDLENQHIKAISSPLTDTIISCNNQSGKKIDESLAESCAVFTSSTIVFSQVLYKNFLHLNSEELHNLSLMIAATIAAGEGICQAVENPSSNTNALRYECIQDAQLLKQADASSSNSMAKDIFNLVSKCRSTCDLSISSLSSKLLNKTEGKMISEKVEMFSNYIVSQCNEKKDNKFLK